MENGPGPTGSFSKEEKENVRSFCLLTRNMIAPLREQQMKFEKDTAQLSLSRKVLDMQYNRLD